MKRGFLTGAWCTIQLKKVLRKRLSKHNAFMKCAILTTALKPLPPCPFKRKTSLKGRRGNVTVSCLAGSGAQMKNFSQGVVRRIKRDILLGSKHRAVNPSISQNIQDAFIPTSGKTWARDWIRKSLNNLSYQVGLDYTPSWPRGSPSTESRLCADGHPFTEMSHALAAPDHLQGLFLPWTMACVTANV